MVIIEVILCAYGIYMVYAAIQMKKTGNIPARLISNKINLERSKDIPGFIKFMFPRCFIFGIIMAVCSLILGIRELELISIPAVVALVAEVLYLAAIIYYVIIIVKAQNRFLF